MSELKLITPSEKNSGQVSESTPPCLDEMWDSFWALYPRHVAKLAARKAWAKTRPEDHVAILEALVSWRPVWRDKDPEYLPHGSTWLNGERWEDELPHGYRKVTAESPQTALDRARMGDQTIPVRQTIPEHIQAVIDRLTGKKKPA
jgi:hypothetical protein